jgi:hypothetical protein
MLCIYGYVFNRPTHSWNHLNLEYVWQNWNRLVLMGKYQQSVHTYPANYNIGIASVFWTITVHLVNSLTEIAWGNLIIDKSTGLCMLWMLTESCLQMELLSLTRFENDRTIIVRPSRWSFFCDDLQTYTQVCPLCIATRNHLVTYQIASPGTHLALVHDPSSFGSSCMWNIWYSSAHNYHKQYVLVSIRQSCDDLTMKEAHVYSFQSNE